MVWNGFWFGYWNTSCSLNCQSFWLLDTDSFILFSYEWTRFIGDVVEIISPSMEYGIHLDFGQATNKVCVCVCCWAHGSTKSSPRHSTSTLCLFNPSWVSLFFSTKHCTYVELEQPYSVVCCTWLMSFYLWGWSKTFNFGGKTSVQLVGNALWTSLICCAEPSIVQWKNVAAGSKLRGDVFLRLAPSSGFKC